MDELKLPEKFSEYAEARRNGFLKAKAVKESGQKLAGIFCTYTPLELLDAAGMHAVSLCGTSNETVADGETYLPKNLCPLIKSSYGFAVSDKCPYTYFADLIVGESTCDGKKKMYELLGKLKQTYILQLPQSVDREYSLDVWTQEMRRFRAYLEEFIQESISDEALRKAVVLRNRYRAARCRLLELQKLNPAPLSGLLLHKTIEGTQFSFNVEQSITDMNTMADQIESEYRPDPQAPKKKRILVTGCPIGGVVEKLVAAIEENGGQVVCLENCGGIKPSRIRIDPDAPDILEAIAAGYLEIGCSIMSPNLRRETMLRQLAEEFQVDGVVDVILQACHTYNIETYNIRNLCRELDLPYMSVETDYSVADKGQMNTRLAAFIEML